MKEISINTIQKNEDILNAELLEMKNISSLKEEIIKAEKSLKQGIKEEYNNILKKHDNRDINNKISGLHKIIDIENRLQEELNSKKESKLNSKIDIEIKNELKDLISLHESKKQELEKNKKEKDLEKLIANELKAVFHFHNNRKNKDNKDSEDNKTSNDNKKCEKIEKNLQDQIDIEILSSDIKGFLKNKNLLPSEMKSFSKKYSCSKSKQDLYNLRDELKERVEKPLWENSQNIQINLPFTYVEVYKSKDSVEINKNMYYDYFGIITMLSNRSYEDEIDENSYIKIEGIDEIELSYNNLTINSNSDFYVSKYENGIDSIYSVALIKGKRRLRRRR